MSEQIFCKYCKGTVKESLEQEQGYHEFCFLEMIKEHPDLAVLEPLVTQDRMLVESLLQMRKEIPLTVTQVATSIELGWGTTRSSHLLKIELTTNPDQIQRIQSITLLLTLSQIHFDFTLSNRPKISLENFLNYRSDEIKRIASYEWFFIYTIFDTIIMRHLQQHLPASEFEYLQSVKSIIDLPIFAFNHQFIYFSKSSEIDDPFLRLQFDNNTSIIGLTVNHLEQLVVEKILSLKRNYYHNLAINGILENSESFYDKFKNIERIDHLLLTLSFPWGEEYWSSHVFDYASVSHLQLQSLGLWMSTDRPSGTVEMINYPHQAHLQVLILDRVDLPVGIQKWTIDTIIIQRNYSSSPTQFDNLPEDLIELKIDFYSILNEENYMYSKIHLGLKKLVILNFSSSNKIFKNEIPEKLLRAFPQATIDIQNNSNVKRWYLPVYYSLDKDWYFSIAEQYRNTDS